jgi:2-polyprenyl-3-methyl-5-hydroxy-6-metoxy-1,4-benzoquinol methylase
VGSLDINGSLRTFVEAFKPASYIGVDIQKGPGVDQVCVAEELINHFGHEKFDLLISTELLEHVKDWKKVISNFKGALKANGILLITTRSIGFAYHEAPFDFWRYQISDMKSIFSDFIIEVLEKDSLHAGVFMKARKPINFKENNLGDYPLFSIIKRKKISNIEALRITQFDIFRNRLETEVLMVLMRIFPLSIRRLVKKILRLI